VDGRVVRLSEGVYVARESTELRLVERLAQPSTTALVGDAGHGKTAMVWRMHRMLSALGREPLVVPASALLGGPERPAVLTVDAVAAALAYGRRAGLPLILLVDTLDLLLRQDATRRLVRSLLRTAAGHRLPTLVTCRPVESRWLTIDYDDDTAPISGVRLEAFTPVEQAAAITMYAKAFYPPERAAQAAARVSEASVRGLPARELSRNPLQLRLLFELFEPDDPPDDVDAIGLFEQYWSRRIHHDDRGPDGIAKGPDLTAYAEAVGFVMLTDGSIEAHVTRLAERVAPLTITTCDEIYTAIDQLRARGVMLEPHDSRLYRFFHQTFFEYAAARGVVGLGRGPADQLVGHAVADSHDLFVGEVAAQVVLLAGRDPRLPGSFARDALLTWFDGDAHLQLLALRSYARLSHPAPQVRARAAAILATCDAGTVRHYLRLLPSTRHPRFERVRAELGLLWSRVTGSDGDPGLGFDVLRALARAAPVFPEDTRVFIEEHECLKWLLERTPAEICRESLHLQLLDPLRTTHPAWCAEQLLAFFVAFAGDSADHRSKRPRPANVPAMADIVQLLASIAEHTVLSSEVTEPVTKAIRLLASTKTSAELERQYAFLRGEMLATLTPAELLEHTWAAIRDRLVPDEDAATAPEWTVQGRRAELRACARAAAGLTAPEARTYLDALLTERNPRRQEGLCALLGEMLSGADALPITVVVREVCARHLRLLPAERGPDGSRPVPMLFVNALHGADVGGRQLLAALPADVPDRLWSDRSALLPLLVFAALADHPGAQRVMQDMVLGRSVIPPKQLAKVLQRLHVVAVSPAAEARAAFAHLVDNAEATGNVGHLRRALHESTIATVQLQPDQHDRLVALRRRVTSPGPGYDPLDGYVLWRLLVERLIDIPPTVDHVATAVSRAAGPVLTGVLEFALCCVRSSDWAERNPAALVDALDEALRKSLAGTPAGTGTGTKPRDRGESLRRTHAMIAREALIAARSRLSPLPSTPGTRRAAARRVFDLLWESGYDLRKEADRIALAACIRDAGHLIRRLPDKATAVDLLLDVARRLHADQPEATRWRERMARRWYGAIVATVRAAPDADRHRLISGLLTRDPDLAGAAIRACVDHVIPPPAWLSGLEAAMDDEVREHYRSALRRQAREGGRRTLDDLYDGVVEGESPAQVALADNRVVTMPEPVDDAQRLALTAIWDSLVRDGRWPTFHELDQRLNREHDLDAAQLLPRVPPGLLYGVGHGSNVFIGTETRVGLTVAGAAATGRAQRELGLFLDVVRHAVELERDFDPPTDNPHLRPVLTSTDAAELLGLISAQDQEVLNRLGALLVAEQWGSTGFGGVGSASWQASIGREVRRFRQVENLDRYWELRPKFWEPDPQPAAPTPAQAAPSTQGSGDVPALAVDSAASAGRESHADGADGYGGTANRVDVLVIAALREELEAARDAALATGPDGSGIARWEPRSQDGLPYWWGEYRVAGGRRFTVALARPTQMGGRVTGTFAATIADRLRPAALAMSGVCAGNPEETALGDVVVGEPVYEWDEGKRSPKGFQGDHRQLSMDVGWLRAAQEFDPTNLPSYGEATDEEALLWVLEQLHRNQQPRNHPAREAYFPAGTWKPRLDRLEKDGFIVRNAAGRPTLTTAGTDRVQQRLYEDVDGPQQLPFRVMVSPMASGSSVISDPKQWADLKAMGVRKITAIEMEAATIATIAQQRRLPWLVAKGVMDHADTKKDDRYKQFAARASAQVMFALLAELVTGEAVATPDVIDSAERPPALSVAVAAPVRVSPPTAADIRSLLDELATTDPTPDTAGRKNGRLFFVVHPSGTAVDALAEVSSTSATGELNAAIQRAIAARGGSSFSPDLDKGMWRRRSNGMVSESGVREDGSVREDQLLVVKIAENGQIGVICGRATAMAPPRWRRVGDTSVPNLQRVILPALVIGLVHGALRLAGDLAQRYAEYDGPWGIGLRLTGIRGAIAYDHLENGDEDTVPPYDDDTYERILTADTAALLTTPDALTSQLAGALLRGLNIENRYPPQPKA
jgi:nucleoside phosphorylase